MAPWRSMTAFRSELSRKANWISRTLRPQLSRLYAHAILHLPTPAPSCDPCPYLQHVVSKQMHKIDMPNKDVILEVVVHLSGESLHHTNIAKDGNAPKPNADHAATTTPTAPAFGEDTTRPSVSVSSTGRALTIVKGGNTVGGKGGGGRLDLILPQPIVPGSTKSFFWDGDLTIRAVLAAE